MTEEAALGRWPRRLLHVPTMQSHRWHPGNIYGTTPEPQYNALTYTWGRWMLRDPNDRPHARPVDIGNIGWDIPRVDPSHFTRSQFLGAIRRSVGAVPVYARRKNLFRPHEEPRELDPVAVEFLWVDVACINQRPDEHESSAEIGRQADIFRGARHVFIWLTTFPTAELHRLLETISLSRGLKNAIGAEVLQQCQRHLDAIQASLESLCADPWFTSLWTLQEMFLRPDAMFLSRDGHLADDARKRGISDRNVYAFSLEVLALNCSYFGSFVDRVARLGSACGPAAGARERHSSLVDRSGISAIHAAQNPLVLLAASGDRTTLNDEDRVYGIQQVFGFRLGTSATKPSKPHFEREELDVEFGRAFVSAFPVLSQLHVFTSPAAPGAGWRPGSTSSVLWDAPAMVEMRSGYDHDRISHCTLTTTRLNGVTLGFVSGSAISFASLADRAQVLQAQLQAIMRQDPAALDAKVDCGPLGSLLGIYLDATEFSHECAEACPGYVVPGASGGRRYLAPIHDPRVVQWLSARFPRSELVVLSMRNDPGYHRAYGLLLLRAGGAGCGMSGQDGEHWRRLGFCSWVGMRTWLVEAQARGFGVSQNWEEVSATLAQEHGEFFGGTSDDWRPMKATFG